MRIKSQWGGVFSWVGGSKALDPLPLYNSDGFPVLAPATPSFFGHRSLVWLFAGAPFRFVVVQAPCQNLFVVVGYPLDPLSRPKGSI